MNPILKAGQKCYNCNKMIFAVYTPSGADYNTCPICHNGDWDVDYDDDWDVDYDDDWDYDYYYCDKCNILYDFDKMHAVEGCTDNIYYGKLVTKYKLNGKLIEGMPKFESYKHYLHLKPQLELFFDYLVELEYCEKATYPERK